MITEMIPADGGDIYRLKFVGLCMGTVSTVSKKVGDLPAVFGDKKDLFLRSTRHPGETVWFKFRRMKVVLNLEKGDKHILILKKA